MNIHRLEVFFFVVEYQGINEAARNIPWGITPSAISKNIAAMEENGRKPLFIRSPFKLLPLGKRWYQSFKTFYDEARRIEFENAGLNGNELCIGASPFILREYIVPLTGVLRRRHPDLRIKLFSGTRTTTENRLRDREIDLAIVTVDDPPTGWHWQPLLERPVMLFVPASLEGDDAWAFASQAEPPRLALPPETEAASRRFTSALKLRNESWPVAVRASETGEIPLHVVSGDTVGVAPGVGSLTSMAGVRALTLPGVEPVTVGALWATDSPALRTLLKLAVDAAQSVIDVNAAASKGLAGAVDMGARSYVGVTRKTARAAGAKTQLRVKS